MSDERGQDGGAPLDDGFWDIRGCRIRVLYEDNHLLVAVKPQNLPVCEDESGDVDFLNLLKAGLKERHGKPGNVFLGLVHRLDRPAGGVMVFAKTSKAASRLSEQMRVRETDKTYLAVVSGRPNPEAGRLTDWLLKDERSNLVSVVREGTPGAKHAALSYETIEACSTEEGAGLLSLVRVRLETGRAHQIRVQLASRGWPLFGDAKYGGRSGSATRGLALWCEEMTVAHPVSREKMTFCCAPPAQMPWQCFAALA